SHQANIAQSYWADSQAMAVPPLSLMVTRLAPESFFLTITQSSLSALAGRVERPSRGIGAHDAAQMGGAERGGARHIDTLEELAAGIAVEDQRLIPGSAVGRDLEVEIVVAGGADLGAAGIAGLEEERGGVSGRMLVELALDAIADVVEKDGSGLHAELVGCIGDGIDAEHCHVLQLVDVLDIAPDAAVEYEELRFGDR